MDQEVIISALLQQSCDSAKSLLLMQQTLAQFDVDLSHNSQFAPFLTSLQAAFSMSASSEAITLAPTDSSNTQDDHIFHKLQCAVRDGTAREKYPVGKEIPDQWTDVTKDKTFAMPWRIVDYRDVLLANGEKRLAAILLRIYASPIKIKFNEYYTNIYDGSNIERFLQNDYRDGCTPELLDAIAEIQLPGCVRPATLFIPRAEELHIATRQDFILDIDQTAWEYFRDTPYAFSAQCQKRVFRDANGISQVCWTRSKLNLPHLVWTINTYGSAEHRNVSDKPSCALVACAIA